MWSHLAFILTGNVTCHAAIAAADSLGQCRGGRLLKTSPEFHTFHRHFCIHLHSNKELHILTELLILVVPSLESSFWLLPRKMDAGRTSLSREIGPLTLCRLSESLCGAHCKTTFCVWCLRIINSLIWTNFCAKWHIPTLQSVSICIWATNGKSLLKCLRRNTPIKKHRKLEGSYYLYLSGRKKLKSHTNWCKLPIIPEDVLHIGQCDLF